MNSPADAPMVSREQSLLRSARFKAALVAFLNGQPEPVGRSLIAEALSSELAELGYTDANLDNFLYTLSKNGLIKAVAGASKGALLYASGDSAAEGLPPGARRRRSQAKSRRPPAPGEPAPSSSFAAGPETGLQVLIGPDNGEITLRWQGVSVRLKIER